MTKKRIKGDEDERKVEKWIHNGLCKSSNLDDYRCRDFYQCH